MLGNQSVIGVQKMKHRTGLLALAALAFAAFGATASATEFVSNGGFESTLLPISAEFGGDFPAQQVTDWATNGYNFVFRPGEADTVGGVGSFGGLKLWGPGTGVANGLTGSPAGGNYVAADPQFITDSIRQTISGLTIGQTYNLSFYYAAAQQFGFDGETTEGWHVTFGSQTFDTTTINLPNHGFSGWSLATTTFTASATSQVLSFLATGGPSGSQPPFSLLDGVSLTGGVPEPAAWALMIMGFGGIGVAVRRRRALA